MDLTEAVRAWWLAESDRRDTDLAYRLIAWLRGWRACETALDAAYEAGYADALMAVKHAQHDAHRLTQDDAARWGPGGRSHFGDARPGDYPGKKAQRDAAPNAA
jgi:hypothetical protein